MNGGDSAACGKAMDFATVAVRWLLGAVFIYTGLEKVADPVAFLKLVRQYDLFQSAFPLNSIAAALPWFEVFCGLLLLAGVAVRGVALTLIAILIPFTGVVWHRALVLQAAKGIAFCAVKFDCGCGTGEVFICGKLLENFGLILLAGWLLAGRGRNFSLRYSLCPSVCLAATDVPDSSDRLDQYGGGRDLPGSGPEESRQPNAGNHTRQ
jgi:putative oxidoreductase